MHAGPLALRRLYWFRFPVALCLGLAGALLAGGIVFHHRLVTVLGGLAAALTWAKWRRLYAAPRLGRARAAARARRGGHAVRRAAERNPPGGRSPR